MTTTSNRTDNAAAKLRKNLWLCELTARIIDTSTAHDRDLDLDELDLLFYWSRAVFWRREYDGSVLIDGTPR
jgi:hypothetical protein